MRRIYWVLLHLGTLGFLSMAAKDYKREIMDADRAFDLAVSKGGSAAWASFFAEDGKMLGPQMIEGRAAVREAMTPLLDKKGNELRWSPTFAEVSKSGDLGYTIGESRRYFTDKDGKAFESTGRYISVWRRGKDGSWKVAVDTGTSTPPKPVAVRP